MNILATIEQSEIMNKTLNTAEPTIVPIPTSLFAKMTPNIRYN